jgi:hypothetical protein|tara:strand:- start:145 stop:1296 length:1152 start_codon:yes stop_codon:yes gene_type:complete
MSEIKVNSIKGVAASTAAITVNNTDGSCAVNNTQRQGKNLIHNGAMQVHQRTTSSTSNGYQTLDRYKIESSNITHNSTKSVANLTSSDTPYSLGFRKYARIALAQAGVVAANSAVEMQQRIEAQDVATSGWNYTSSSSNISLQFWFRCSTNQTFYGYLYSFDGTAQVYTFSFTASGNDTWTKITKTIPGNSNLTFNNDDGPGLQLKLIAFYGTDFTNNKTLDQWAAYVTADQMPDMASTWLTAGASTFDVTGIQLEVGDTPTDFEHKTFNDELITCQRYLQILKHGGFSQGVVGTNQEAVRMGVSLITAMRTEPSVSVTGTINTYDGSDIRYYTAAIPYVNSNQAFDWDSDTTGASGSQMTAGRGCVAYSHSNSGGFIISAEL